MCTLDVSRVFVEPDANLAVVFFPMSVLVVLLIKHILWNTYMRHYTSDAMLLNTVYSQTSESAMMLETGYELTEGRPAAQSWPRVLIAKTLLFDAGGYDHPKSIPRPPTIQLGRRCPASA